MVRPAATHIIALLLLNPFLLDSVMTSYFLTIKADLPWIAFKINKDDNGQH